MVELYCEVTIGYYPCRRAWLHEMERVFSDRFTDYDDLKYFTDLQKATVDAKFGVKYEQIVTTPHLVYADFLVNGTGAELS